jgi:predicted transcriptional regulator
MQQSNTDWTSIKAEYEQGLSQRSLALKYGISQAAISQKASKEKWLIKPLITPATVISSDNLSDVDQAIADLMQHLTGDPKKAKLLIKEHKLFADAMSQYKKLKTTSPDDEQEYGKYDLREFLASCTPEELAVVVPITKAVAARKAEADGKITPLRRQG